MRQALTAEQLRAAEALAVERTDVALADLMHRAGCHVARTVTERVAAGRVVVMTGAGNNGGDGWVAAGDLARHGRDVIVLALRSPEQLSGIAADAAAAAVAHGVRWHAPEVSEVDVLLEGATCVVDAMLGIGASGPLRSPLDAWVSAVARSGAYVVAVDVPTGIDADSGAVSGPAIQADVTVTFSALKPGLLLYPGAAHVGEVVVADVGIPAELLRFERAPEVWEPSDLARIAPVPAANVDKYGRGEVLVVAGSGAYPGAAVLAAWAAQRAGAGFIRLAVPAPVAPIAQAAALSVVTVALPADEDGTFAQEAAGVVAALAQRADAVVCGPGLSRGPGPTAVAEALVGTSVSLVLDADGLNAFASRGAALAGRNAPTVLTPHARELGRLLGRAAEGIEADRLAAAAALASSDVTVVLKGAGSVIATGAGTAINTSGSAALATAGTGDVLAGAIGALLAQGLGPYEAACLGAWVHGRAGEIAEAELSPVSVVAEDVSLALAAALAELVEIREQGALP